MEVSNIVQIKDGDDSDSSSGYANVSDNDLRTSWNDRDITNRLD